MKEGKKGEKFLDITEKDIVLWLMTQVEAKLMFRERRFLR